jgi:hypothetical protein
MPIYNVPLINSVGTTVKVEADSPEDAADKVWESDGFQNLGGLCFSCEGQVGALGDWEIAGERDGKPEIELA